MVWCVVIHVARGRDKWSAAVNTVMNLGVLRRFVECVG